MKSTTAISQQVHVVRSWAVQMLLTSIRDENSLSLKPYRAMVRAVAIPLLECAMMDLPL